MSIQVKKLPNGVLRLPDGTIAYSMERALVEFERLQPVDYTVNDLILFVLNAQRDKSVMGRTAMFKEIFVIEREVFGELLFRWDKVPGDDTPALVDFMNKHFGTNGELKITKKDDKTIDIQNNGDSFFIKINDDETKAVLKRKSHERDPHAEPLYVFFVGEDNNNMVSIYYKTFNVEDCEFIPYHFGPYSFHVANKLENLIGEGLLEHMGKKNTKSEEFIISPTGQKVISQKYERLPVSAKKKLQRFRQGLDQFGTDYILNYVYDRYPQFKTKSKIGQRYKLITWGKGKG